MKSLLQTSGNTTDRYISHQLQILRFYSYITHKVEGCISRYIIVSHQPVRTSQFQIAYQ